MIQLKTRNMQTQLFPQLVDPMIRLVTVAPRKQVYPVNFDCQKSALQILKEIIKAGISFDDSRQLVFLIDRLKTELSILKEDFELFGQDGEQHRWIPSPSDDSDVSSLNMQRR